MACSYLALRQVLATFVLPPITELSPLTILTIISCGQAVFLEHRDSRSLETWSQVEIPFSQQTGPRLAEMYFEGRGTSMSI